VNSAKVVKRIVPGALAAALALLPGCGVPKVGERDNVLGAPASPEAINWPARYRPEEAAFFVHNEIEIAAPPEAVWEELIAAETWPEWYEGASGVKVEGGEAGRLGSGSSFAWRTMDLDFVSTVTEFDPPRRLSWESRKWAIQGYHAWLLIPTAGGTRLMTDESQHGILAVLQGIFMPVKLSRLHDVWLAGIKTRAEARAAARGG
jgi:uncharacterized protein YndB with AHSA1/START domain